MAKRAQAPVIFDDHRPETRKKNAPLTARTESQADLIHQLTHRDLTFAVGPAGTGKTFVTTVFACDLLRTGRVDRIIVTRPMVSSEDDIGFLPGTAEEKFAPFFAPVREIMEERMGTSAFNNLVRNRQIELSPLGFLRGHTFKRAFVIFDEAQNTTPNQMRLFLTRIGEGSKACVGGDLQQMDITGTSGLQDAMERHGHLPEVGVVTFRPEDCVRSGLVLKLLQGYK